VLPPTSATACVTPGAIANTFCRSRPRGIASSTSLVKATLAAVLVTSTTGLWPLTVTDSSIAPTLSTTSTRALKPTVRRSASRR
jgi:hypothetical protein